MNIAYYMPFKPMGHPHPSGDLIIGSELFTSLHKQGMSPWLASSLRLRWVYYKPLLIMKLLLERKRVLHALQQSRPDLWLSYHCYYKAPDLLGSYCAEKLHIPYIIFQGIYSTKRRKKPLTYPGFILNKHILEGADHIFTNKKRDFDNLKRIIPSEKLTFIAPGLDPEMFRFSQEAREKHRNAWKMTDETIIMTTAMMRPGVKAQGILQVIEACSDLTKKNHRIKLVIAGDGQSYDLIKETAETKLQGNYILLGRAKRDALYEYYSAADIFAFPGIQESLGMVYLEAQSCALPAVAYEDWGGKEAIVDKKSGLLSPASNPDRFIENIERLVKDRQLRRQMGEYAAHHIRKSHDLKKNYRLLTEKLQAIVNEYRNVTKVEGLFKKEKM